MKPNIFLYLTAGFNAGALSSILLRMKDSDFFPSRKEIATMVLSGLAAASSVGFLLSNKKKELKNDDFINMREDTAKKMETMLI